MKTPVTGPIYSVESLKDELFRLGLQPGMRVIVHSSYKAIGHVIGGPASVILALEEAITPDGSILMPTFTEHLCDPSTEENSYPPEYWDQVRQHMPIYQADLTPATRSIGIIPELFRKQDGVIRSAHPHVSCAAWGKYQHELIDGHPFHFALGEGSPLARLYDLDGYILFLGAPLNSNTSLHLAEYRLPESKIARKKWDVCVLQGGKRTWTQYDDVDNNCDDFPQILEDYMKAGQPVHTGKVGNAACYFLPQRSMVDFGVGWMSQNRAGAA